MYYNQYSYYNQQQQQPQQQTQPTYAGYSGYSNYASLLSSAAQSPYYQRPYQASQYQTNYENIYKSPNYSQYAYNTPSAPQNTVNTQNVVNTQTYYQPALKPTYKNEYLTKEPIYNTTDYSIYDKMYAFNASYVSAKNLNQKNANYSSKKVNKIYHKTKKDHHHHQREKSKSPVKKDRKKVDNFKKSLSQKKILEENYLPINKITKPTRTRKALPKPEQKPSQNKPISKISAKKKNGQNLISNLAGNNNGLTATEDVDMILEKMGYSLPAHTHTETQNGYTKIGPKEKQDLMFSYGLTEPEFDKAEKLFKNHCKNGKFEIKSLAKIFPNNSLAERIQLPELTNDDGDFLKFEEYLNIYQILKDLDL